VKTLLRILVIFGALLGGGLSWASDNSWVRYNYWPLFFYQSSADKRAWELEIIGPFYYCYFSPKEEGSSFRPLISTVRRKKGREVFFLSPLGHYFSGKTFSRFRLVPLFAHDTIHDQGSGESHHSYALIFWGETKRGKYGGFFPFYGTLKDWGFRDEVTFFLWPLYIHSQYDGNDSYTFLWPFFNRTKGPSVQRFKIWPLYGHRVKKGESDRTFFLWPFFWHEKYCLSGGKSGEKDMFLPFWIREKSPFLERYVFLWPFFQYSKSEDIEWVSIDFPWPFFRYIEGTYDKERRLWPLIGFTESESITKARCHWHFFLWPLYFYERCEIPNKKPEEALKIENRRFLLFTKFERVKDKQGHLKYQYSRVWPLGVQIKRDNGFELFYFPALLPFEDEGMNRNYGAFLRLYEYVQDPEGFTRSKALWGFYRHDKAPQEEVIDLAFLFTYHRKKEAKEFTFLKGLIGIGNKKNDYRLKLFYLKIF